MSQFILVRHGQTGWNKVERFRGRADLALDEVGKRQAAAVGQRLASVPVVAVYSSPLKRALMTAEILAQPLGLTPQTHDGLLDIDFGLWQGLSPEEAKTQNPELFTCWIERPHEVQFPQGESLEDVRSRVVTAVEHLATEHEKETVVLVSHVVVCRVLLLALLDLDDSHFWQVGQNTAAINAFELRDRVPMVTLINDCCHLKNLAQE